MLLLLLLQAQRPARLPRKLLLLQALLLLRPQWVPAASAEVAEGTAAAAAAAVAFAGAVVTLSVVLR
jgi:hypothetical protein